MKVRFLPQAEDELDEAVANYNKAAPDLGIEFALEVREGLRRVIEFPEAGSVSGVFSDTFYIGDSRR